jgi:antitoxin (DNA-binding transcriptional repressor) of toxin-antitoxin stability system
MKKITIRDLRNQGGQVVERVLAGEHLLVTRDGHAVAELRPTSREPLEAGVLLERWRTLPRMDGQALRREIDDLMDSGL